MKLNKTLTASIIALSLVGCASPDYAQYSKSMQEIAASKNSADTEKYKALASIAASGDSTAKVAAVMALSSLGGATQGQSALMQPQPNVALQWASILVPGLTQVAGMRYNYMSQSVSSNNATALGMSTNTTFSAIAGKIQAPTTITTLSGTGTLGSGAYSTSDNHSISTEAPFAVPTVVTPTVIQPVTIIEPTVVTPTVIQPVVNSVK
jgi:hypothetical protein